MIESIRDIATRDEDDGDTSLPIPTAGELPNAWPQHPVDAPGIAAVLYERPARRLATVAYHVMLPDLCATAPARTKSTARTCWKGRRPNHRMQAVRIKMTIPPVMDDLAAMMAPADTQKEAKKD